MITCDDLLYAGWGKFKDTLSDADCFFQKQVYSADGVNTLYFINVHCYNYGKDNSFELNMSFDRDSKTFSYCWIKYAIDDDATVSDIENMARDIFVSNNGLAYEN